MTDTTQAAGLTDLADWLRKEAHDCEYGAVCTAMDHPQAMQSLMRSRATMLRRFEEAVRAALAAQAVPAGWKLVPVEPTPEMVLAAWGSSSEDADSADPGTIAAWGRMLAASPAPAEAKEEPMLNGLTKAETEATASVLGLIPAPAEAKEEPKKCACGSTLTAHELHYYGNTCEQCEGAAMAAIEADLSTPQPQAAQPVAWQVRTEDGAWGPPFRKAALAEDFRRDGREVRALGVLDAASPELTEEQEREPMTRFCPGCGSVGPVEAKYRDCCPDGSKARVIPESLANDCRALFRLALYAAVDGQAIDALRSTQGGDHDA